MTTVIIGASGGIGKALADLLEQRRELVQRLSRRESGLELTDEATIAAAATSLSPTAITRLIIAAGMLHEGDYGPERALKQLSFERLMRSFAVNAVGPALVLKHFAPLLARDRPCMVACLSARVGSIADNRLGGWYGYRASKAALNQLVRTAAVELSRTHPLATIVALHPGTVDTAMSRPFQAAVPPDRLFTPAHAAERLLRVMDRLTPEQSGGFLDWKGEPVPF